MRMLNGVGSNNTRVRNTALILLYEEGPLTIGGIRDKLNLRWGNRTVPSSSRLIALLSRTRQVKQVGEERVQTNSGWEKQTLWDINRKVVRERLDLTYTTPFAHLPPKLKKRIVRCDGCKLNRLIPEDEEVCLFCSRDPL